MKLVLSMQEVGGFGGDGLSGFSLMGLYYCIYRWIDAQQVMAQLFEVNMPNLSLSAPASRLLPLYLSRGMIAYA